MFRWYKSRTLAWNWLSKVLVSNYLFKFSNKNTEKRCDICSKLTIKSPEQRQWRGPGAFIVNFELNNPVNFKTSYQTNRIKRCKINNSFSEWAKISAGVSRGFVLGHYFSIFSSMRFLQIFLQKSGLANYADGSTMHASEKRVSAIVDSLRHEFTILSKYFYNNFMVLNPEKCSFMLLGVEDSSQTNLVCGDETLKNWKQESVRCNVRQ